MYTLFPSTFFDQTPNSLTIYALDNLFPFDDAKNVNTPIKTRQCSRRNTYITIYNESGYQYSETVSWTSRLDDSV